MGVIETNVSNVPIATKGITKLIKPFIIYINFKVLNPHRMFGRSGVCSVFFFLFFFLFFLLFQRGRNLGNDIIENITKVDLADD
jgi:hypothetical protein